MVTFINFVNALGGYTPTVCLGVFMGSVAILIIKRWFRFPNKLVPWLRVCLIFSLAFLAADQIVGWHESNKAKDVIRNLTPKEKYVLETCAKNNDASFLSRFTNDSTMIALTTKGIVYKAYEVHPSGAMYIVNQFYLDLARKYPELVASSKKK